MIKRFSLANELPWSFWSSGQQQNNDVEFIEVEYCDHSIDNAVMLGGEAVLDQLFLIQSVDLSIFYLTKQLTIQTKPDTIKEWPNISKN